MLSGCKGIFINQPKSKWPDNSRSMKNISSPNPVTSSAPPPVFVCFEFTHPTATTVCIAGTFNHWQPESITLHSSGAGNWWKKMTLAPGTYEYCLVVDGKWIPDPCARESVPNPFGGRNSILTVANSPEAAHLADAENLPLKNDNQNKTKNT